MTDPTSLRPRRPLVTLVAAAALALAPAAPALAQTDSAASSAVTAAQSKHQPALRVGGDVTTSRSYTLQELRELSTVTAKVPVGRHGERTATGASLFALVSAAAPKLPDVKNAILQPVVTVYGDRHDAVSFALGELNPSFGNRDALLVTAWNGRAVEKTAALAVPGDRGTARSISRVSRVQVSVPVLKAVPPAQAGSVTISNGGRTSTLSAAKLAKLRTTTRTVTFLSGSGQQTRVETGPLLADVLRVAGIRASANTWVSAVGSDGVAATVTLGESSSAGSTQLLSLVEDGAKLTQPRLVPDGDVRGGRYISDVVTIVVGNICR